MKMSNINKFISGLLGVARCPMMLPTAAFAADDGAASEDSLSPTELISLLSRKAPIRVHAQAIRLLRSPNRRAKRPMRRPAKQLIKKQLPQPKLAGKVLRQGLQKSTV